MAYDSGDSSQRRAFLREAAKRLIGPVVDLFEGRSPPRVTPTLLRPPGAIDETRFLDTCRRCGACVDICPAEAIFPLAQSATGAAGTPVIDPELAACVVCDGLKCTTVCPSGALLPLTAPEQIRMGLAEVDWAACVRSHGEACRICVDQCPLGETAIRLAGAGPPEVHPTGCVGCGVCQLVCPTTPRAIVVRPC